MFADISLAFFLAPCHKRCRNDSKNKSQPEEKKDKKRQKFADEHEPRAFCVFVEIAGSRSPAGKLTFAAPATRWHRNFSVFCSTFHVPFE
jgi:hypothetical protein